MTEIWPKYYKEVILKVNIHFYYWIKNQDHSGAPMSTDEYGAKVVWGVWAPSCHAYGYSLMLMSSVDAMAPCLWIVMVAYECPPVLKKGLVLINAHECLWCYGAMLMSAIEHLRALMSNHDHSSTWQHGANSTNERKWALLSIAPWHPYPSKHLYSILISAYGRSWGIWRSSVILNAPVCLSSWFSDEQKMLTLEITALQYFGNILVRFSPNDNKMDIWIQTTGAGSSRVFGQNRK